MNYKLHYEKLINRAKDRKINGYTETHHIIPRCMNGTDDKDNLVDLTAREHFIAHLLLLKIYPKQYSLIKALNMMCMGHTEHRSMNRMYGWLREKFSKEMSVSQSGDKNSQHGTIWIHNLDLKESKKIPKGDNIPDGWLKGRKINFELKSVKICNKCGQITCIRPDICRNTQRINTFIEFLGFDPNTKGKLEYYNEFDRVVELLKNDYIVANLSIEDIKNKYKFNSNERVRMMFKSLNIELRTKSEARNLVVNKEG